MKDNSCLNIICVGANIESLFCLQNFADNHIRISGVITLPLNEEKRGSDYRNLAPFCNRHKIPIFYTDNINSFQTKEWLLSMNPDVIFILGWSQIFDNELIQLPNKYIVGSHPSDLPYGAGRAPVVWTILEDLRESAVTFFKVIDEVDAGNIILKKHFYIPRMSTSKQLYDLVAKHLSDGFVEIYHQIINNLISEEKQDLSKRTLRVKRVFQDGWINFSRDANEINRLIRATTEPFPGAFSYYNNNRFTFWMSSLSDIVSQSVNYGEVLDVYNNQVLVQCYNSTIWAFYLFFFQSCNFESILFFLLNNFFK